MPVSYHIEEHADGSRTVWLSEHDPFDRSKGMVGICLYPGKAYIETKVRLYNRTPFPLPFLWWNNTGVHAGERYQVFFPPDVNSVTYHARRYMTSFPIARGIFDMNDFGSEGVDISWVRNTKLPSSYFANPSSYDFFGGYDHERQAGIVHVANRHIAPGKKFFTWGFGDIGFGWCNELTDNDGPYLELMAGVYTDNQPDYSWLQPYETRSFSQFWYPIQNIGPVKNADHRIAVNLDVDGAHCRLAIGVTEATDGAHVTLASTDRIIVDWRGDLAPGSPLVDEIALPEGVSATDLTLRVCSADGH
jgi:hypothetical protein